MKKSSRFLSSKNADWWQITRNIDNKAYKLAISEHVRQAELTFIFHSWKLHLASSNSFFEQVVKSSSWILIQENFEFTSHEEYEVLEIVNCREIKKYEIQYKAIYIDFWNDWNANSSWQFWTDFVNSKKKILKFHVENKNKSAVSSKLISTKDNNNITSSTLEVVFTNEE